MAAAVQGMADTTLGTIGLPDRLSTKNNKDTRIGEPIATGRPYTADPGSISSTRFHNMDDDMDQGVQDPVGNIAVIRELPSVVNLGNATKNRGRRASEGASLTKFDSKRTSGELKCEKCGKFYKHRSCLAKHLWEHTPEWSYTSKLLISKHQQVQLLEAASVLVTMNQDSSVPPDSVKASDSDDSPASPAASGYSEIQDDDTSSVETSPPPLSENAYMPENSEIRESKRYSSNSSTFSRSYQSIPSGSVAASSMPTTASYGSYRHGGYQRRPSTSGVGTTGPSAFDDEAGLAAAVELCNFGTPRTGPIQLPPDIPPVPPLPERYQSHNAKLPISSIDYPVYQQDLGHPPPLTHRLSDERDVRMYQSHVGHVRHVDEEDDFDQMSVSRGRSDEDDDGVFGRMEE
ncbi:MAG: hypothetical protein Q9187_001910 [Circinaria calcarea]